MENFNQIKLAGHLAADADCSINLDGDPEILLSLAVESKIKEEKKINFFRLVLSADILQNSIKFYETVFKKGTKFYCQGLLNMRVYITHDDFKKYVPEILVDKFEIIHE